VRLTTLLDRITQVINKWDPANLMSHAPDDEYNFEVGKIEEFMKTENEPIKLAHAIKDIFYQTFGDDVKYDLETYIKIANEILDI
jgi:hypothetical protein